MPQRGAGRARPWRRWERSWRRWGCGCIRTRRRWSICGTVGRAWIFWAVTSEPACRGGCGNRSGSCATTCTAGPARRRWPGCGARFVTGPVAIGSGADIRDVIAESESDPARLGQLLSHRQRRRQVPSDRRLRGVAAVPLAWSRSGAATCVPDKPINGPKSGSTGTACTACAAPSATRRLRNHAQKIIGKPCAGKPHARIERGITVLCMESVPGQ